MLTFHYCYKCNVVSPVSYMWAGTQARQYCTFCGEHVAYVDYAELPTVKELREQIWGVAQANAYTIDYAKKICGFQELITEKYRILQYNKLLLTLIEIVHSK